MINEFCVTDVRSHRLNVRERVLLTMTKLKLDLSYVTLGALFSISGQLCKTYFFDFLTVLSQVLKVCNYFPSAEEVSKNLPKCFKNFKNCRAVLDCIEIFIQRPSGLLLLLLLLLLNRQAAKPMKLFILICHLQKSL
nr:unnamed protein product [Callosobruchus analis]